MKKFLIIISFIAVSITCVKAQVVSMRIGSAVDSSGVVGLSLGQKGLNVGIKDSLKPDIVIDGVKYDYKILDIIDQSKISSMTVLKGEAAIKEYNAPNGAVLITSKAAAAKLGNPGVIRIRATGGIDGKSPAVLINGKIATQEELSRISPDLIESINIIDTESVSKVNNGANPTIVVTTKKSATITDVKIRSTDENVGKKAVVIIDGKVTNQEELAKIPQSDIKSIKYLRGEEAESVHKGAGVVVVVKTK